MVLGPKSQRTTNVSNAEFDALSFAWTIGTAIRLPFIESEAGSDVASIEAALRQTEAMGEV